MFCLRLRRCVLSEAGEGVFCLRLRRCVLFEAAKVCSV